MLNFSAEKREVESEFIKPPPYTHHLAVYIPLLQKACSHGPAASHERKEWLASQRLLGVDSYTAS